LQFVVNGCAKEKTVINFQHILHYRAVVNLVIGIFTGSYAVPRPQMSSVARCMVQLYMWQLLYAQLLAQLSDPQLSVFGSLSTTVQHQQLGL